MKLYQNLSQALKERDQVTRIKLSLNKTFPDELMDLTELEEIFLEGECTLFPKELKGWRKVKTLTIKWNQFQGDLSNIFTLISLTNLKIIDTPIKTFLLPLGNIPAPLEILSIKKCGLTHLPEEISMLHNLTELYLPENNLSSLPQSLQDLKKLKRLNLDKNQFKNFPESIKRMATLKHLSIDNNKFSDEEKARIQKEFFITVK